DALANAEKGIDKFTDELNKYKSNEKSQETLQNDKNLGELGKALAEYDNKLTQNGKGGSADSKQEARAAVEKSIAAAAEKLAAKLADGNLSESDKQMIQNTLSAAAENAKGDPELQAAIEAAKQALANNDAAGLKKALNDIGTRMASN